MAWSLFQPLEPQNSAPSLPTSFLYHPFSLFTFPPAYEKNTNPPYTLYSPVAVVTSLFILKELLVLISAFSLLRNEWLLNYSSQRLLLFTSPCCLRQGLFSPLWMRSSLGLQGASVSSNLSLPLLSPFHFSSIHDVHQGLPSTLFVLYTLFLHNLIDCSDFCCCSHWLPNLDISLELPVLHLHACWTFPPRYSPGTLPSRIHYFPQVLFLCICSE